MLKMSDSQNKRTTKDKLQVVLMLHGIMVSSSIRYHKSNCSFRSGASIFQNIQEGSCSPNTSKFPGSTKIFKNRFFRSSLVCFKQTENFQGTTKVFRTDLKFSGADKKYSPTVPTFSRENKSVSYRPKMFIRQQKCYRTDPKFSGNEKKLVPNKPKVFKRRKN